MRRLLLVGLICLNAAAAMAADMPFDFEVLQFRAKSLAAKPYVQRASKVPKALQELSYDLYRDIRFDPNRSWWRREQLPFQLQFFHPGSIFNRPVQIFEVRGKRAAPIPFDPQLFRYDRKLKLGELPAEMGFAGSSPSLSFRS